MEFFEGKIIIYTPFRFGSLFILEVFPLYTDSSVFTEFEKLWNIFTYNKEKDSGVSNRMYALYPYKEFVHITHKRYLKMC